MNHSDIKIGGRYTAKVGSITVVVRVQEIYSVKLNKRSVPRYSCRNERTNRLIIFRSPQRFRAELGKPVNEIQFKGSAKKKQLIGTSAFSEFRPDWVDVMTAQEAKDQLQGFKFSGPGWYTLAGDTMLVIAFERPRIPGSTAGVWNSKSTSESERFQFNVYNQRNPIDAFNLIINAPTRT